jgi:hypothetical protein
VEHGEERSACEGRPAGPLLVLHGTAGGYVFGLVLGRAVAAWSAQRARPAVASSRRPAPAKQIRAISATVSSSDVETYAPRCRLGALSRRRRRRSMHFLTRWASGDARLSACRAVRSRLWSLRFAGRAGSSAWCCGRVSPAAVNRTSRAWPAARVRRTSARCVRLR